MSNVDQGTEKQEEFENYVFLYVGNGYETLDDGQSLREQNKLFFSKKIREIIFANRAEFNSIMSDLTQYLNQHYGFNLEVNMLDGPKLIFYNHANIVRMHLNYWGSGKNVVSIAVNLSKQLVLSENPEALLKGSS